MPPKSYMLAPRRILEEEKIVLGTFNFDVKRRSKKRWKTGTGGGKFSGSGRARGGPLLSRNMIYLDLPKALHGTSDHRGPAPD